MIKIIIIYKVLFKNLLKEFNPILRNPNPGVIKYAKSILIEITFLIFWHFV